MFFYEITTKASFTEHVLFLPYQYKAFSSKTSPAFGDGRAHIIDGIVGDLVSIALNADTLWQRCFRWERPSQEHAHSRQFDARQPASFGRHRQQRRHYGERQRHRRPRQTAIVPGRRAERIATGAALRVICRRFLLYSFLDLILLLWIYL